MLYHRNFIQYISFSRDPFSPEMTNPLLHRDQTSAVETEVATTARKELSGRLFAGCWPVDPIEMIRLILTARIIIFFDCFAFYRQFHPLYSSGRTIRIISHFAILSKSTREGNSFPTENPPSVPNIMESPCYSGFVRPISALDSVMPSCLARSRLALVLSWDQTRIEDRHRRNPSEGWYTVMWWYPIKCQ